MTFVEKFLRKVPADLLKMVVAITVTFLLLIGFSSPYIEPGSGTFVVVILTLVPLVTMLVASLLMLHFKPKDEIPELD